MDQMASKSPKHYARMIRDHVKALPGQYADDPTFVQEALGLTDEEFELGMTFCIAKKIFVLEKPQAAEAAAANDMAAQKKTSTMDDDTQSDKKSSMWDDESARQKK